MYDTRCCCPSEKKASESEEFSSKVQFTNMYLKQKKAGKEAAFD